MSIVHKLKFGVYHYDTFDYETFLVDEAETLQQAEQKIKDKYGNRINKDGADRVDIVDSTGSVVKSYSVT